MLYKKYVIEVVYETQVIELVDINSNNNYPNQIQLNITPSQKTVNVIKYVAEDGCVQDYVCYFDTSDEAFEVLSTHYYTLKSDMNFVSVKISTVLDDLPPPPEVLRALKIKNILD